MCEKIDICGLLPEEICSMLSISPSFRGRQIFQWISKGVESFDQMKNLDKATLSALNRNASLRSSRVSKVLKDTDGTIKLQITLKDGRKIETVLLTDLEGRKTACVSCQAGCAMACAFCKTGTLGLGRNLTSSEIVEEFLFLEKEAGTLDNIVFMGMGEPLQNLEAVQKAVQVLTSKDGRALSSRRITLSTCGLVSGIRELADSSSKIRLAVSLTTADQALRERLMPVAKGNPLPELKKAIGYYIEKTGKRVTLEAALLSGVNTDVKSARQLVDFAKGLDVYVNLIPWNPIPELEFSTPSNSECNKFKQILEDFHINVNLRIKKGGNIAGACGQLGNSEGNAN